MKRVAYYFGTETIFDVLWSSESGYSNEYISSMCGLSETQVHAIVMCKYELSPMQMANGLKDTHPQMGYRKIMNILLDDVEVWEYEG